MTYRGQASTTSHLNGSSEFVRHEPCDNCGSSDANSIYSDGHSYCFSCHHYNPGDDAIHTNFSSNVMLQGEATRLNKRNLSEVTCKKYRIYKDGDTLRFHYYSSDGRLLGAKVKTKDKKFSYVGETDGTFFGQHLFPNRGGRVVITEGELDAASCLQALPSGYMVSLPSGAASAKKSIQRNLEWLQTFDEICLFFDNDDPGRQATQEAASVLPPGKVTIAHLSQDYKDASEALSNHDEKAIREAINDAKPYRPDGIVDGKTLLELVTTPEPPNDYNYPYEGLNKMLHGIRRRELITLTAGSGSGKSSICRDICANLLRQKVRCGYLALEESNRRTALGLMSAALGKSFHLGEHDHRELQAAYDKTLKDWDLYLFDGFGSFDPDIIYNRIEYLATGLDTQVIFLDHLSILLSGLDGDERRMIDHTMTKLRSLVERTGITLFLVSHLRRTNSDVNHEEGARVTLGQLRGSAAIAQLSDSCIALERDQQGGPESNATTVRVLKNRYSGEVGIAATLSYDLETCKFHETQAPKAFDPSTDF